MRICFCIDTMESGGAERVASVLCNEFSLMGHKVDLIMISEKEKVSYYHLNDGVNLIPLLVLSNRHRCSFLNKIITLKKVFNKSEYDVVISFLPNVNICVWLAKSKNSNFIHIVSERNDPHVDPKGRIRRLLKELAFKNADGIVCQTQDSKDYILHRKIRVPIEVIKNPVSVAHIKDFSVGSENDIISVGRLEKQKNFELLIKAFYIFSKTHHEAKLKIYGTGTLKESLEALIRELNLEGRACLCGNSNTWVSDNINCSMFISSSLYEGMPNALLEAISNKIPCIASDCPVGGSKELLNKDNGLLFKNGNIEDLINKMEILYKNEALIQKFRINNSNVSEDFSANSIAKKWLLFAKMILDGKTK